MKDVVDSLIAERNKLLKANESTASKEVRLLSDAANVARATPYKELFDMYTAIVVQELDYAEKSAAMRPIPKERFRAQMAKERANRRWRIAVYEKVFSHCPESMKVTMKKLK